VRLTPDFLNSWLNEHHFADPPVEYDLAASTGPVWTLRELLALGEPGTLERMLAADISYVHSAGGRELRGALAEMAGVEPEHILVTTGAAEALWIAFLLAAAPGANVVLPQRPSFPTFHEAPARLGMQVRRYPMPRESGYALDLDDVRALADRDTKMIVVNRPLNPTGAVISDDQLDELHELAVERGIQLLVDEVMHPIYHGPAPRSASRLPGATVLGDFSKAMCLSGLRLGWIVERDPDRRAGYEQARSYLTVSSGSLSEALGLIAVAHREVIYERARAVTGRNLAVLDSFFSEHGEQLAWVRPRGGMTAFPWLRSGQSSRDLCRAAAAAGVLLAPGDCFGTPEHFRIGFGASDAGFAHAIERLDELARTRRSASPASL
jgi:aspartate/methionine/tyrosine aminotransferase